MGDLIKSNVIWQEYKIGKDKRANQKHQKPCILWFTGLSGSGKSTLANALEQKLFELNYHTYLLDGDNVRHGLNKDLGFSDADRQENIRRIGELSAIFVDAGIIVLTAFISPFRGERSMVRNLVMPSEFVEIHVATPFSVCEKRDPKGMYKKARAGEIKNFTGIDSAYEPPLEAEIVVDTSALSLDESVSLILEYLYNNSIINGGG